MEYLVFLALCGSIGIVGIYDAIEKRVRKRRRMKRTQALPLAEVVQRKYL